jgi:hypothetical protein
MLLNYMVVGMEGGLIVMKRCKLLLVLIAVLKEQLPRESLMPPKGLGDEPTKNWLLLMWSR